MVLMFVHLHVASRCQSSRGYSRWYIARQGRSLRTCMAYQGGLCAV
jgi:hypothetical protein